MDSIEDGSGSGSHDLLQVSAKFFSCSLVSNATSAKEGSVVSSKAVVESDFSSALI